MLRSFLARPRRLLSFLPRHDCRTVVACQLGHRADQVISRSFTSSEDETESDVDRPEARDTRKHLYVVLDDWKQGFSIHKLDLDDGSDGGDLSLRAPVHRQETDYPNWNFATVGSKIVAAGRIKSNDDDYVTLVYDTETTGLSIVPRLPEALRGRWYLPTPVGNGLYTFEYDSKVDGQCNGGMHRLEEKPSPMFWWTTREHWSWSNIPTPLPFRVREVESSAVHPEEGGHTLFVSVGEWNKTVDPLVGRSITQNRRTFSYDMGTGEWSCHGDMDLPFYGHARYNAELDVWVGLQKIYGPNQYLKVDGYLCSCDVPSPNASPAQPDMKLCAERQFDPFKVGHTGASLVYMGGSNYCLVEVIARNFFDVMRCADVGNKCDIRISSFRLKYGKNGELIITARRPDRSYLFSRFMQYPEVRAFWM